MKELPFTILNREGESSARTGLIDLARGSVHTPAFMPIGTYGAVKTLAPWELKGAGAEIILSNAYHLYLRPGTNLIERSGGLHQFMGWDRPILTDSGGYQVFSLAALRKIDDDGVTFRSHLDGADHHLTPEKVIDIQRALGSDLIMAFDECPPGDASRVSWAAARERTTRWAARCVNRFVTTASEYPADQYLLLIVQGGTDRGMRRRSAEELLALDASGYAIGGLAVGEPKEDLFATLELMDELLPTDKLRYLMGVGTPADIVRAVAHGVDIFDCVLPTRNARNGQLFTKDGPLNIRNAVHREDLGPVEETCDCETCARFSRAYLRHLFQTGETLGLRLATLHNLRFYLDLMQNIRTALVRGDFGKWSSEFLTVYNQEDS